MCSRYSITTNPEAMRRLFEFSNATSNIQPRYNAAPLQDLPVVRLDKNSQRELVMLRWGLIPSWANNPTIGHGTINARAETVARRPAFREAFRKRRCLVPADGFYEWKTVAGGKQPHRITLKYGAPFAMAGLWERWRKGDQAIESFSIIVTRANDLCREIHDHMPVILYPETWNTWLKATDDETLTTLVQPFPAHQMTMYPVSRRVGSPKNDDVGLIAPIITISSEIGLLSFS